ncbi:MAG: hypothetical protein QY317_16130 [Candidatus Jettenia caeni]|nr:MAG: hypothetical protein QY317_16130 [Candidatus Jettenia caeni]
MKEGVISKAESLNLDLSLYEGTVFNREKLERLSTQLKEYERAKKAFGKSHSQWMDINLILSKPTPIRNARQALAHIERSYQAIKETEYKIKKQKIEREMKLRELKKVENADELKAELLRVEIEEIDYQIKSAAYYFEGALKTIQTYIDAYEQICRSKGVEGFDEMDFEKQEEEYHVKTAILQSMRSIRASGRIDPGNQEYLEQCGINPSAIEKAIQGFLMKQDYDLRENKVGLDMSSTYNFIDNCYLQFKGYSKKNAEQQFGIAESINKQAAYRTDKSLH